MANLDNIYTSYKPLILTATQLLRREPSFNSMSPLGKCTKRSLLPFLGDALSWLTGRATTKNLRHIKRRVNLLIETQTPQQETLVHIISILNITRYAMQVNRQHINTVMQAVQRTHNDVTTLFNITSSIYTCINYQQIFLHICSIPGESQRLLVLPEVDSHVYNGIHRCSHYQYIITTCTSSRRFEGHADAHQSTVIINHALTSVIRWHSLLL